ncbi:MAG TPA: galactokinase [Anaerolineaceae bacterium]|nr:galactokinase [Anaerolineaceae bacterium]
MIKPISSDLPTPQFDIRAPGRVNLLGEHVDYNDGIVLPAAIDRYVHLQASQNADDVVELTALDLGQKTSFPLENLKAENLPDWARYPAGVAWAAMQRGLKVSGIRAVFTSTVPIGAGLSSSAAVEVAFGALWNELNGWGMSRLELARLCQQAENQFVGVNCGLMDQFASACGVEGHALMFDTRSLEYEPVPLPPGSALVIADSGVRRSLAGSVYNQRRADCEEAVRILRNFLPGIGSLRDVGVEDFNQLAHHLPEQVRLHARHVVEEIDRVQKAVEWLKQGNGKAFGQLMYEGHASLRDLYQVSIPELDILVEIASRLPGCFGARLTGAGFGGCTVNLVEEEAAQTFVQGLAQEYTSRTGKRAEIYICHASEGVSLQKGQ